MKFYRQYPRLLSVFVILLVLQACSGSESQQKGQGGGQRGQRGGGGRGNGEAVQVKGTVLAVAESKGVKRWHLSMSHDGGIATATVIAEG